MSKTNLIGVVKPKPAKNGISSHWTQGLLTAMKDPDLIISQDDKTVTIKDKYPKAKHHFLILPKEKISSLKELDKTHLSILNHMAKLAEKLKENHSGNFKIGYHAVPSMQPLHLHVISDDFESPCLKSKTHWNTYTTEFFIPSNDLIKMIEENGRVNIISHDRHMQLIQTPLKCHKCDYVPKNMPTLKTHILSHVT